MSQNAPRPGSTPTSSPIRPANDATNLEMGPGNDAGASTDCVRQAGRKESPNSQRAAGGRAQQWGHPERLFFICPVLSLIRQQESFGASVSQRVWFCCRFVGKTGLPASTCADVICRIKNTARQIICDAAKRFQQMASAS